MKTKSITRLRLSLLAVVVTPIVLLLTACPPTSPPAARVTAFSAGNTYALATESDGSVWAWGANVYGQLGNGTTSRVNPTPSRVLGPQGEGDLTGIVDVAAGGGHSLALAKSGTVWAWGFNYNGQVGDGTTTDRHAPVQVSGLSGVSAIAAGASHSLALEKDGTVWAWGYNYHGEVGIGSQTTSEPNPVEVLKLGGVTAIAAGSYHSLALKSDGTVWAWGMNDHGQLGNGNTTDQYAPVQVNGLSGVTAIAAGYAHSLALKSDGTVWAWGANTYGQLGDGTTTDRLTPVKVTGLTHTIGTIAAGGYHSFAIDSSVQTNVLWAWGRNTYGQLGDGTTTDHHTPVQRQFLGSGDVEAAKTAVAAGTGFSLALENDHSVWSWGSDNDGRLGDGNTTDRDTPGTVSVISPY